MKKYIYLFILASILLLLTACAPPNSTFDMAYPRMYQNTPQTVLILPPINNSTAADAKEYFSCSLSQAVGLKGYYPLPVEAMFGVLRDEGLYDTENINPAVLKNFKEHFGADAVLLSTIEKWDKSWAITSGSLKITSKFVLMDTATADTLWNYTMATKVTISSSSDNLLMAALESAIKTATEDYFPNCLKANVATMDMTLPYGKHHPGYLQDKAKTVHPRKTGKLQISK